MTTLDAGYGEAVATVSATELHAAIVDAIVDGLEEGAIFELVDGLVAHDLEGLMSAVSNSRPARLERIRRQIADEEQFERRARRNANNVDDDDVAKGFLNDARAARATIRRLESEQHELLAEESEPLPAEFTSDVACIVRALAAVKRADGPVDGEVADAVGQIIDGLSLRPGRRWVDWSCSVLLPADGRVARVGPFSGRVRNRAIAYPGEGVCIAPLLAREFVPEEAVERGHYRAERRWAQRIEYALGDLGLARLNARAVARCPIDGVAASVLHHLRGDPLPPELDPSYVQLVIDTYVSAERVSNRGFWRDDDWARQRYVDAIILEGGCAENVAVRNRCNAAFEMDRLEVQHVVSGAGGIYGHPFVRVNDWRGMKDAQRLVTPRPCPHCGGWASLVLRVREVPSGVLCDSCMRMPRTVSPQYPAEYVSYRTPV